MPISHATLGRPPSLQSQGGRHNNCGKMIQSFTRFVLLEADGAGAMRRFAALHTQKIESFDQLDEVVAGVRREIVQIEGGKLHGELSHALIGDLPIDIATFNLGLRSKGSLHHDRLMVSMLAGSSNRVTRSSYESRPGDVMVTPPRLDGENRYYGGASVIAITLSADDIESSFASEAYLGDPFTWRRNHFKGNADNVRHVIPRLRSLVARLGGMSLNAQAAEFWKRVAIEAMTADIVRGVPSERDGPLPSALKVVRQVEEHLDMEGPGPIHVSQICGQLHVSRRTLHRAFHEALGIGPIAYLRYRRLCAVHSALRSNPGADGTIADLAFQHGFQNAGRFSCYYHQLFGEYPSDTRLRAN